MSTEIAIQYFTSLGATVADARKLHLSNTDFDDADSQRLVDLPDLTHLVLNSTRITDNSLLQIGMLAQLEILDLSETPISDAINSILKQLSQLRVLGLYATQITDAAVESISGLPKLEMLNISLNPQLTDIGFQHLAKSKRLKSVEVHGTQITDAAVNEFSARCPNVLIVTDAGVVRGNA